MKATLIAAALGLVPSALAHGYHARRSDGEKTLETRADRSTKSVPRPKIGNVPYGSIITRCTQPGVVALTFDDGPSTFTPNLLNELNANGAKATFFITANNIGPIESQPFKSYVQLAYLQGHQIAHHSWTHQDFSLISRSQREDEILFTESAIAGALGRFPTYIRPPYGSCNSDCLSHLNEMGYHIVNWDVDTEDWRNVDNIALSEHYINQQMTNSGNGHIVLAHDIHQITVDRLAGHMIRTAKARGLRMVTVGECLGDPSSNWYREFTPSTNQPTLTPSPDGTCGSANQYTCQGTPSGNCCSQWGWCGSSIDHCGTNCQRGFGTCN